MPLERIESKSGFTLVEVLMAALAASVLALSAGAMVFYGFRAWDDGRRAVQLQSEGTVAMAAIGQVLRGAARTNVTVATGQINVGTKRLYRSNAGDFVYDVNTGAVGDEIVMVYRKVTSLTPVLSSSGLAVQLVLQEGAEQVRMDGAWAFRN